MRTRYAWLLVGLLGCTKAGSNQESASQTPEPVVVHAEAKMPAPTPAPPPAPPAPPTPPPAPAQPKSAAKVTVLMTAATLADDCGGGPPAPAPKQAKSKQKSEQFAKEDRACDQSSMQLSVKATAGGAAIQLTVKKVELFDDKGVLIGALTSRSPTMWTKDGMYKAWDQKIAPGQELAVSYALSSPPWAPVTNRRHRTYVLKAVVTIGGKDQTVQRDVQISAPTSLPPGVKT